MSWDDEAATWDDNPAVQTYSRAALRSLHEVLQARGATLQGARVLDFGCGTGLLTAAMADTAGSVVGLDISPAMVAMLQAKGLANVEALAAPLESAATTAPLSAASFDLVTCSSVCAFVDDYPATVARLVALLKPGGVFVQWDWELDPTSPEPMGLSRSAIEGALGAAGLTDIAVSVGFEEAFEGHVMAPLCGAGQTPPG